MRNTTKMIKIIFIASLFSIFAACSSGETDSNNGINLTGTWVGTLQDTPSLAFDVTMFISQTTTVDNNLGSSNNSADINYSVTFTRSSDNTSTDCAETINNLSATVTLNSGQLTISGTELNATASNSQINGQAVFSDTCGGPINLRRR